MQLNPSHRASARRLRPRLDGNAFDVAAARSAFPPAGRMFRPPDEVAERRHNPVGRFFGQKMSAILYASGVDRLSLLPRIGEISRSKGGTS